jgi:hypothetical protein
MVPKNDEEFTESFLLGPPLRRLEDAHRLDIGLVLHLFRTDGRTRVAADVVPHLMSRHEVTPGTRERAGGDRD